MQQTWYFINYPDTQNQVSVCHLLHHILCAPNKNSKKTGFISMFLINGSSKYPYTHEAWTPLFLSYFSKLKLIVFWALMENNKFYFYTLNTI